MSPPEAPRPTSKPPSLAIARSVRRAADADRGKGDGRGDERRESRVPRDPPQRGGPSALRCSHTLSKSGAGAPRTRATTA